jgi:hypothetical protein
MYIQEKNTTEDLAVWARPFAFRSYGELTKKKKQKNKNKSTDNRRQLHQLKFIQSPFTCTYVFNGAYSPRVTVPT